MLAGAEAATPPNIFVAGVAGSAGFGVAAPKLNMLEEAAGATAGALSVLCASEPAPKPAKAGVAAGATLFCVEPPKLKRPVEGAGVLEGAAELVAPNWKVGALVLAGAAEVEAPNWKEGVLGAAGVEAFAPKVKVGCEAGAGVLGVAAEELAPPKVKACAPFVVPNMLVEEADELDVGFC